ncbi:MAG: Gfo/Idh/MocA family oxidoreductase [Clostridia bacterium]|nr:Gfo/Idh/MocA family oxidoreductase [Clostridia bacterium]
MYNILLIGCGHMGAVHLDDIYTKNDVCIYAVVDLDVHKAEGFAKKYGARNYGTDYMEFLPRAEVDIVICATYPKTHLEILKQCVKYKKHLLCEKPITPDMQSAIEFAKLVKKSDIKVQIGYILRFNETYCKVAELIQNGVIGKPVVMRMTQNHHVLKWGKYRALLENASPIVDCGVHYVDICRWFTGADVVSVGGICQVLDEQTPHDTYNYGLITMRLSDGSVAYYEAGWGGAIAAENTKEFIGPKGRITIVERENRPNCHEEGDLIELYDKQSGEYKIINLDCVRRPTGAQLEHLIDMIENGADARPDIDDVIEGFKTVLKADEILKNELFGGI